MSKNSMFDMAIKRNIVKNCKNEDGKVNVNRAISIARAKGLDSFIDRVRIKRLAEIEDSKNK